MQDRRVRIAVAALCLLAGTVAMTDGLGLLLFALRVPHPRFPVTPFEDFTGPALVLSAFVAPVNLVAAWSLLRKRRLAAPLAFAGGAAVSVFSGAEMMLLETFGWLEILALAGGLATMLGALALWHVPPAIARRSEPAR